MYRDMRSYSVVKNKDSASWQVVSVRGLQVEQPEMVVEGGGTMIKWARSWSAFWVLVPPPPAWAPQRERTSYRPGAAGDLPPRALAFRVDAARALSATSCLRKQHRY